MSYIPPIYFIAAEGFVCDRYKQESFFMHIMIQRAIAREKYMNSNFYQNNNYICIYAI